jgi:hypothetical protein
MLGDWRYRVAAIVVACVLVGAGVTFAMVAFRSPSGPGPVATEQDGQDEGTSSDGKDNPGTKTPDSESPDDSSPDPGTQNGTGGTGGQGGSQGGGTGGSGSGGSSGGTGGSSGGSGGSGGGNGGTGDCALPKYPTAACTGVPAGWSPSTTINGDFEIFTEGAVIENYLVTGWIVVRADNVTIRNTRTYGGITNNYAGTDYGPTLIEDSEVVLPPGQTFSNENLSSISGSNYTCRRCKIDGRIEGFRIGSDLFNSGPVVIEHSYVRTATDPDFCAEFDPHGDGIQGYFGKFATIHHNTIDQRADPCHTSPIFIADNSEGANVTDNLLAGGGYTLRLIAGSFPTVTGNKIVDGTWDFGAVDSDSCQFIGTWSGNASVTYDFATGTVLGQVAVLNDCA